MRRFQPVLQRIRSTSQDIHVTAAVTYKVAEFLQDALYYLENVKAIRKLPHQLEELLRCACEAGSYSCGAACVAFAEGRKGTVNHASVEGRALNNMKQDLGRVVRKLSGIWQASALGLKAKV